MIKACPVLKHFVSELTAKMTKKEETTKTKRSKKKKKISDARIWTSSIVNPTATSNATVTGVTATVRKMEETTKTRGR